MRMIKNSGYIFLLFIVSSCTHYNYVPNMHNVPLFQQKEEFHLDLSGSVGNEFSAFEVQAGFSLSDNFAVIGNGFFHDADRQMFNDEYCRGHIIEGGAGAFVPMKDNMVFESYFGVGFGKIENGFDDDATTKLDFNRYFIQPSLGYTSDFLDFAVSLRLSGLRYNDIHFTGDLDTDDMDQIQYINRNPFSILVEPALTLRAGWEHIKFQLQFGYSINTTNPDLLQEDLNASIGMYFTISDKYKKRKNPSPDSE
jgi:hypothetical protein